MKYVVNVLWNYLWKVFVLMISSVGCYLQKPPYTEKYSVEFDRVESPEFYKTNDPANAEVANYRHELIVKRVFGTKHYWFPLPDDDVYLYPEFGQNPGW